MSKGYVTATSIHCVMSQLIGALQKERTSNIPKAFVSHTALNQFIIVHIIVQNRIVLKFGLLLVNVEYIKSCVVLKMEKGFRRSR